MKKFYAITFAALISFGLSAQIPINISFEDAGNFKAAEPAGIGEAHFIERGEDITYTIHFQNEGQDTAYNVRVLDTLSMNFDINSLREEGASHPYNLTIFDDNVLRFSFPNIKLPTRAVNESESKGFIRFTVSQKEKLPLMTFIANQAHIFFDFFPPVLTNEVYHTISEGFTNSRNVYRPGLTVHISPNPIGYQAFVDLDGVLFYRGKMEVYDLTGKKVAGKNFRNPRFQFTPSSLPGGQYFFKIILDNELAATGRFVVK